MNVILKDSMVSQHLESKLCVTLFNFGRKVKFWLLALLLDGRIIPSLCPAVAESLEGCAVNSN